MDRKYFNDYNYIISYMTPRIQTYLKKVDKDTVSLIQEIRVRSNRPLIIVHQSECYFLTNTGKLSSIYSSNCVTTSLIEITEIFNKICGYSLHSHYDDVLNGYITLQNGARVGLTGTAVYDKNVLKGMKDIDGMNIRFPRQIRNFSSVIFNEIYINSIHNLLIAGPPSSGKTTMLKDLIYQLSSGKLGKYHKTCVIDERKEIISSDKCIDNLGYNTDVLYGYKKSIGISMAIRCLSPEIIICDEIGLEDSEKIIETMNSGVKFIFTIHAENYNELKQKNVFKALDDSGCIGSILFLNDFKNFTIISDNKIKEVTYESICNNHNTTVDDLHSI